MLHSANDSFGHRFGKHIHAVCYIYARHYSKPYKGTLMMVWALIHYKILLLIPNIGSLHAQKY